MKNDELTKLFDLIRVLRGEDGCPWDRAQKPDGILSDLVEEAYELQWAYAQNDRDELLEELGDVVFVLVFAMQLIQESHPEFTLERVTTYAHDKIKRRHPHVFGDAVARTKEEGLAHWNRMKEEEKMTRPSRADIFADIPGSLSPMRRAEKVQQRAARAGFDWPDTKGIFRKIHEEIDELEETLSAASRERSEDEIGDLFFSVMNLSRFLNIDAEKALTSTNAKFVARFQHMRQLIDADGRSLDGMSLEEMDRYWENAKAAE